MTQNVSLVTMTRCHSYFTMQCLLAFCDNSIVDLFLVKSLSTGSYSDCFHFISHLRIVYKRFLNRYSEWRCMFTEGKSNMVGIGTVVCLTIIMRMTIICNICKAHDTTCEITLRHLTNGRSSMLHHFTIGFSRLLSSNERHFKYKEYYPSLWWVCH